MSNSPYKSVLHCLVKTYKTEGIKAFYRSYTTQMMMNIPFQSTHFVCYELGQKITNKEGKYNPLAHMVSGAMAGGIAAAITTPLDVCKTLLNTQQGSRASGLIQVSKKQYHRYRLTFMLVYGISIVYIWCNFKINISIFYI